MKISHAKNKASEVLFSFRSHYAHAWNTQNAQAANTQVPKGTATKREEQIEQTGVFSANW